MSVQAVTNTSKDCALICGYLNIPHAINWAREAVYLTTLLIESGHSVDIIDSKSVVVRVAAGKGGITYTGKGETVGAALLDAIAGYVRFIGKAKASHVDARIQPARSAMPFHTAFDWMIKGRRVRRVIWPAGATLRLERGQLTHKDIIINGRVSGVPVTHYRDATHDAEKAEPVFIFAASDTIEFPWPMSALCLLGTDWELDG